MKTRGFDAGRRRVIAGGAALALGVAGLNSRAAHALTTTNGGAPRRVIAIGGALAEIVFALDKSATLVATDTSCTYPIAAQKLPKVGYQRTLSAEGVLSMRPDLILASAEAGPPGVMQQIAQTGVEVVSFSEKHDVDSLRQKIDGIARELGAVDAGASLRKRVDADWQQAMKDVAASSLASRAQPLRVLFLLNPSGSQPMVAGQHTAADAMIAYAGATNAIQGFGGYRTLSPEALITAAPDVVMTTDDTLAVSGGAAAILRAPGFASTPAGKHARLVSLDTLLLLGFGPRLPAAVTALNRQLVAA
ncbi:ABC transporter substrate-binding protein [Paraburkholderia sp.]|uniref:heme/hemin ABC transporter substrate-binding protein n=1 Tax=Paraburkholderia sp. TaxID=1926495 RepID=UPI00239F84B9|nr:ABC transporter substrate-binding protein [Paraburkholderia sp.]MDE1181932.1 ABC transporter substrate-binding protein [Paraburkholderia sp.]